MRIIYPYNEILPKKSAHDVYIVRNCASLASEGCDVTLLYGSGSPAPSTLAAHYQIENSRSFHWKPLPILRKNWGLPLTWNPLFFWASQQKIRRERPDWVALSVRKQGNFHLRRKISGVKYVYELHELAWYPGRDLQDLTVAKAVLQERWMLNQADAVTVTTNALKSILLNAPYRLTVPIHVVPLAVDFMPLPAPPPISNELHVMYIGQMYPGQGVDLLLQALARTSNIRVTLVGGKPDEIAALRQLAQTLNVEKRTTFLGFRPPVELPIIAAQSHVLVAPFSASGRMPYVAHTKLLEYVAWHRPVLAPDLPVTREHFDAEIGWRLFTPDNVDSLASAMQSLMDEAKTFELSTASQRYRPLTWRDRSRTYIDFLRST